MRWIAALLLGFGCGAAADWRVVKITHQGRTFGSDPLPRLQQDHLFYLSGKGTVTAWGSDGQRLFETSVMDPNGNLASATSVAMDSNGTIAVAIAFTSTSGAVGGIASLDSYGKQVGIVETGRYMPMHLCFDEKHRLWAFGWQRDAENNIMEDDEPYMVVRRFTALPERGYPRSFGSSGLPLPLAAAKAAGAADRSEAGSFLPRSLFSGKLSPFRGQRGLWRVEAAQGRIGGLVHPNTDRHQQEWVELDLDGHLIGRWAIDLDVHGGFAFTRSGRLFLKEGKTGRMFQLDKDQGMLVPLDSPHRDPDNLNRSLLLGAVRDELVFAHEGGRLFHVDAGALPR